MQNLRIVGLDEDGDPPRLMLSDEAGTEYTLPVDEALRSAVAQGAAASAPLQNSQSQDDRSPLSPREIQAKLRAGATVDQVVQDSGHSREHVLRYAGPVADERAYISTRARDTVIAAASSAENHRIAFGDAPATLEAMVKVRLRAIDVPLSSLTWDAWRREGGRWCVSCSFDVDSSSTHAQGIGLKPPAEWSFDAHARVLKPENEWAESLSELPATTAPARRSGRRLTAVDEPFDVDRGADAADRDPASRGRSRGARTPQGAASRGHDESGPGTETEDLLDILRARRGQRLGVDENGDDKLATLLTREEQPQSPLPPRRGRPVQEHPAPSNPHGHQAGQGTRPTKPAEDTAGAAVEPSSARGRRRRSARSADSGEHPTGPIPGLEEQLPRRATDDKGELDASSLPDDEDAETDAWGFSYRDTGDDAEEEAPAQESSEAAQNTAEHDGASQDAQPKGPAPTSGSGPKSSRASRSKRPSMPRWDDILFGSKNE